MMYTKIGEVNFWPRGALCDWYDLQGRQCTNYEIVGTKEDQTVVTVRHLSKKPNFFEEDIDPDKKDLLDILARSIYQCFFSTEFDEPSIKIEVGHRITFIQENEFALDDCEVMEVGETELTVTRFDRRIGKKADTFKVPRDKVIAVGIGDHCRERVVAAAVRAKDDEHILGIRHFSPDMHNQIDLRTDGEKFYDFKDEGFVNQWNIYLTREQALFTAFCGGQIPLQVLTDRYSRPLLWSEDLY